MVERRVEISPSWPFRMPRMLGADGVTRRRGGVVMRLLHVGDEPVFVRAAQPSHDRVVIGAEAATGPLCDEGIARMRFALGVDDDLRPFYERHRDDPLIGPSLRRHPWLRVARRPVAFEALAWAVCEQLIDSRRAAAIEARIVRGLGPRCAASGLRDVPSAAALAGCAPARLESWDLSGRRALALVRVAREVAAGRTVLDDGDHERAWRRLLAIPTIGRWTVETLALHGQGRLDVVPAGDLNLLKLVGRWRSGGDPAARAEEDDVRELFERYGAWRGLAAAHALRAPAPARKTLARAA
jgi:3-methyladenine DNA glycosylase/8-oxoguanine DNA glycosylase